MIYPPIPGAVLLLLLLCACCAPAAARRGSALVGPGALAEYGGGEPRLKRGTVSEPAVGFFVGGSRCTSRPLGCDGCAMYSSADPAYAARPAWWR
jgi:hypothetical protein